MIKIFGYLIQSRASIEFNRLYIKIQSCSTSFKESLDEPESKIFSPGDSFLSTTDENPGTCLEDYLLFSSY